MKRGVLIVSGLPATGKTVIGRRIAAELSLPFVSKDELKEVLFESLGYSDKEWSARLSVGCFRLMDYLMEASLSAGQSIAIETNFEAMYDATRIAGMLKRHGATACELVFGTEAAVRLGRFRDRYRSGERHPGHADVVTNEDETGFLSQRYEELLSRDRVIKVDTTDFDAVDDFDVAAAVRRILEM